MSTGKTSTYIRKVPVKESLVTNTGFKKTRFLHEATEGDTVILLSSLTTPTDAVNYSAPSVSELTGTNLMLWSSNFTLTSSLRGVLIQNLSYVINGSSTIKLLFEAEDGEVFEGVIDHSARTGMTLVDGAPIVASGTLLAGQTDFNVGVPFSVGKYPSAKRGVVQVEIDGQPVYRTDGNAAFGAGVSGDYYEVHAGAGLGQIIRFQPDFINDRFIMVTSVGAIVERPNGSIMAAVETVQGQIDALVPTVAELAGVPETDFQANPNNIDLKTFGDRVITLEKILNLEIPITTEWQNAGPIPLFGTGVVKGATVLDRVQWKQDGEDAIIRYEYKQSSAGTAGSSLQYEFGLPAGLVIYTAKLATATEFDNGASKGAHVGNGNAWNITDSNHGILDIYVSTPTRVVSIFNDGSGDGYLGNAGYNTANATVGWYFVIRVPIVGFQAKQTIREALGL